MLNYPHIAPEIINFGPFAVRWYGFMYVLAFASAIILGRLRLAKSRTFTREQFDEVLVFGFLGVLLGARLGYIFFYNPVYYFRHPLEVLMIWQGGMSFHGGFLGVLIAQGLAGRRYGKNFFVTMDFMAPLVPPGIFFVRLGNFINAELWGRVTDVPWGMVFPGAGPLPRHPSQLYEAILEGLVLFIALWRFSAKPRPHMAVSGFFALGYGLLRSFAEFFRQPDPHLGFLAFGFVTMGMLLCVPIIVTGLTVLYLAYRKKVPNKDSVSENPPQSRVS
ncbi:MAG: prolipoprotein diacylglyceryl transferase [Desulfovibrio sp.]|jgi:phosphatidylglycerol:prolipoprotein diacylglycerol transferase|nr:prolipoprotein diacylglyceryl transferase [Desulfovibrio sp.]